MNSSGQQTRVGLVGYGEVGKIFVGLGPEGLRRRRGRQSMGFEILAEGSVRDAERADALRAGVTAMDFMQALCADADLIISAVTASNTLAVAEEAARQSQPGDVPGPQLGIAGHQAAGGCRRS